MGFYQDKRVLVTGGAGAIGSAVIRELAAAGAQVTLVDDFSASGPLDEIKATGARLIPGDILDDDVREASFSERPDLVIHLAAFFANQNSVEHPERDLMVNAMGTLRVLEAARQHGCKRVVYTSTSSVYDPNAELPIDESSVTIRLTTPYQVSKLAGEMYCWYFLQHFGLEVVVARLFSSYGPGELPGRYRNVIPNFLYRALHKQALEITGTGEESRDFTYVDDIARGLLLCGEVPEARGNVFNLASGRQIQIGWLAEEINRMTGNGAGIVKRPRRDWDQKLHTLGSIRAAQRVLGYSPSTDFGVGLRKTMEWVKANLSYVRETETKTTNLAQRP